jgi:hypothetical protein
MLSFRVCLGADTDQGPVNLDLESGTLGQVPAGWFLPRSSLEAGYAARLSEDRPYQGRRCGLLSGESLKGSPSPIGNLMQRFDAAPYRGRRIRFRAAVRAEVHGFGNQGQLWMRVDRKGGHVGFFDNMQERPIVRIFRTSRDDFFEFPDAHLG